MAEATHRPERITEADVRHVAKLSRLRLTDDEVHTYTEQLGNVLGYIAKINELDLEGVEPLTHAMDLANVLREDVEHPGLPVERVLENAPGKEFYGDVGFFAVPKVLGDGGGA
jgi:aspartyl-tRNA(Asn)/glutamyl-tRNA(Gln) amidotransferase subunit C